eukprot:3275480-Alexandrium_andersonii.AAC.1
MQHLSELQHLRRRLDAAAVDLIAEVRRLRAAVEQHVARGRRREHSKTAFPVGLSAHDAQQKVRAAPSSLEQSVPLPR